MDWSEIKRAAGLIKKADSLIIATGAGMGVDSGLPDFRGDEGFWKAYPFFARANIGFTDIASPKAFKQQYRRAWGFYGHRLGLYRQVKPHAGFALLKRWAEAKPGGYQVFTSNVDGHFQQAGYCPERIYECHGSIHHLQCLESCCEEIWPADSFEPIVDTSTCQLINDPPVCKGCGGHTRPNILMFGDWGWLGHRSGQQETKLENWLRSAKSPVVIEIGAGVQIQSVRYFSRSVVEEYGGRLIRINPNEWRVDSKLDVGLALTGLAGLRAIERCLSDLSDKSMESGEAL